jgi:tRNA-specific 2-thiouridylase
MEDWPGPFAVLKKAGSQYPDKEKLARDIEIAASLVVRYAKKLPENTTTGEVTCTLGTSRQVIQAEPLADDIFRDWGLS